MWIWTIACSEIKLYSGQVIKHNYRYIQSRLYFDYCKFCNKLYIGKVVSDNNWFVCEFGLLNVLKSNFIVTKYSNIITDTFNQDYNLIIASSEINFTAAK